jgi:hypothetical protein
MRWRWFAKSFRPILPPLLALLLALAGAPAPAAEPAPVRFEYDGVAGREAAVRCQRIWRERGPILTAEILPADFRARPVQCFLMDSAAFAQRFTGRLPDWGVGVAFYDGRRIAIDIQRLPAVGRGIEEVFLHEMVHALVRQAAPAAWLPAWFSEGIAMLYSGEWRFTDTVALLLDGSVPPLWRLQGAFPENAVWADQAYRTSLLAVEALRRDYGEAVVSRLIEAVGDAEFETAFTAVTGDSLARFEDRFDAAAGFRLRWLVILTRWPSFFVLLAMLLVLGGAVRLWRRRRRLAQMERLEDDGDPT